MATELDARKFAHEQAQARADRQFELLKLEYERAAERYENIYRAVWQNFSYLALVTSAILTFAGRQTTRFGFVAAPVPLIFWYLATFVPMDAYGQAVRERLKTIEEKINATFDADFGHFRVFATAGNPYWRVATAVHAAFFFVLMVWICLLIDWWRSVIGAHA